MTDCHTDQAKQVVEYITMSTLWSKGTQATDRVENFTVGNDRILDMRLAKYDVQGSMAHIKMLESIGLLTSEELVTLTAGPEQQAHSSLKMTSRTSIHKWSYF